jgi:uncharacterized membrane protein YsdA (DUF1294 family)/cold shock CspA family protein
MGHIDCKLPQDIHLPAPLLQFATDTLPSHLVRISAHMRFEGTLKTWNAERGFGFIEPLQGGQEIFVHIKTFPQGAGYPKLNQLLSFEVEIGPQGKKRAKNVSLMTENTSRYKGKTRRNASAHWGTASLFAIPLFLIFYLMASFFWHPPLWVAGVYVVASMVTFMAYAFDKSAAERRAWRTQESTLHLLALAGGWPGALLAQQLLRHKSTKMPFRQVFWATVFINVAGFTVLYSPMGQRLLAIG